MNKNVGGTSASALYSATASDLFCLGCSSVLQEFFLVLFAQLVSLPEAAPRPPPVPPSPPSSCLV